MILKFIDSSDYFLLNANPLTNLSRGIFELP